MGNGTGRYVNKAGYVSVMAPGHPRADRYGYVYEHVVVAEKALGRYMPDKSEVHHVSKVKGDNRGSNLVICQDHAYHALLHQRRAALMNAGTVDAKKCTFCKKWGKPTEINTSCRHKHYHKACNQAYEARRSGR